MMNQMLCLRIVSACRGRGEGMVPPSTAFLGGFTQHELPVFRSKQPPARPLATGEASCARWRSAIRHRKHLEAPWREKREESGDRKQQRKALDLRPYPRHGSQLVTRPAGALRLL